MNKKIIVTLIVLLFCAGCLSFVSADNSTNETSQDNESIDLSNYIVPISISGNVIEFNDGFTGFCLDSAKESITTEDGFTSQSTSGELQNYVKLAIIEAYKQDCEDDLGEIIASFADGSYKNSNNKVITEVLKSQENIGDNAVVELEDSIEGTFEFELLKPATGDKSDCLAYKVSLKEMPEEDVLGAAADDNATDEASANSTDDEKTADNQTDEKTVDESDASANSTDEEKTADTTGNQSDEKANDTAEKNIKQETIVNETNKTIINKTNTVTINENNTTTINKNNNKIINQTANETPQNATIQDNIMRTVGNPIFILVVVFAILAAAGVYMRKKG